MNTVPFLKLLIDVTGVSLDSLGSQLGYRKGTLSSASRFPETAAGPKLRKALCRHFGLPWSVLATPCSRDKIAAALVAAISKSSKEKI